MTADDDETKANAGRPRRMLLMGMVAPVLVALLVGMGAGWALTGAAGDEDEADLEDAGTGGSWLLVVDAESARADAHELALAAPAEDVVAFRDRPERGARTLPLERLVAEWDDWFGGDPPNATVTWASDEGARSTVVTFDGPRWIADELVLDVVAVDGATGASARPWTEVVERGAAVSDVRVFLDSVYVDPLVGTPFVGGSLCDPDVSVEPLTDAVSIDGMIDNDASQATTIDWGDGSTDTLDPGVTEAQHDYGYVTSGGPVAFTITFSGGCETSEGVIIGDE